MSWEPNPEQRAAIEARGEVFVSAGAGTGTVGAAQPPDQAYLAKPIA